MPKYTIEDEKGRQLTIEADSPPTPDEIEEVFQSALPTEKQYHEETRKIDKLQELSEGGSGAYALDMLRSLATGTGEGLLGLEQAAGLVSPGTVQKFRDSNPTPEFLGTSLLRGAGTMLPGLLPGLGAGGVAGSLMSKVPYARMLLTAPTEGAVGGGVSGYLAPYASEEEHVGNTTSGAISNAIGNSIFRLFGAGKNAIRSRVNPEAARELTLSLIRDKITPEAFEASLGKIRDFDNPLPTNHTVASIVGPDSYELSAIQNAVEQKMAPEFAKLYDQNESVRRGLLEALRTPDSVLEGRDLVRRDLLNSAREEFLSGFRRPTDLNALDSELETLATQYLPDSGVPYAVGVARRNLEIQAKEKAIARKIASTIRAGDEVDEQAIRAQVYGADPIDPLERLVGVRQILNEVRSGDPIPGKSLKTIDAAIQGQVMPRIDRELSAANPYAFDDFRAKQQIAMSLRDKPMSVNEIVDQVLRGERINPTTMRNAIASEGTHPKFGDLLGDRRQPLEQVLADVRMENFPSSIRAGMDARLASHTEDAERAALHASQIGNHTLVAANVLRGWGEKERYRIASELLRNPKKYLEESEKYLAKLMGKNSVRDRASMLRGELATNNAILEGREK